MQHRVRDLDPPVDRLQERSEGAAVERADWNPTLSQGAVGHVELVALVEYQDSRDALESQVDEDSGPVLGDVAATWCGPCKQLEPIVEEIAGDYGDRLKVVKVDVDKARNTAAKFQVMSVPTLVLFRDGQVKDQVVGAVSKHAIAERVDKIIQ